MVMQQPLVSVICVCYNHAQYVVQALDSVIAQTYKPVELIVIDDGSSDNSQGVIRQWAMTHPEVQVLLNEGNLGYCKTFNKALALTHGKYIIDLAADDVLLPERVQEGVTALQTNANAGVTFSDAEHIDRNGQRLSLHSARFPHHLVPSGNVYKEVVSWYFICSATLMFTREVIEYLEGYDESLAYEDFDFWIRSARKFSYVYVPRVLVKKRRLPGSMSHRQYTFGSEQSRSTFMVCKKIMALNQTREEQKALDKRIVYEAWANFRVLNVRLGISYLILWIRNQRSLPI
ncbi:MAG: glycosyltransferase [Cyclobacteriaceae bacterium]|nr:glycosyltransferase [Cyclobacteriaceae bacterium]